MATYSRQPILAWRIPLTEEPGRLQSMGCKSQTQLPTLWSFDSILELSWHLWVCHFTC